MTGVNIRVEYLGVELVRIADLQCRVGYVLEHGIGKIQLNIQNGQFKCLCQSDYKMCNKWNSNVDDYSYSLFD